MRISDWSSDVCSSDLPLSVGSAGKVKGGDRLPWASWDGRDNYGSLDAIDWQLHVYGAAQAELKACCKKIGIPLYEFDWNAAHKEDGFARDAAYLLRPATPVAPELSGGSEIGRATGGERGWE